MDDSHSAEQGIRESIARLPDPSALLVGLFTASPVAFQVYQADGRCLLVNDAFRALFGASPPPEYNVLQDEIAATTGALALIHRAFAGESVTTPPTWYDARELTQVHVPEGRRVAVVASMFPLRDDTGAVAHVAVAFKDVTAEMQARALAEADRRRADAAERRSTILARIGVALALGPGDSQPTVELARLLAPEFADLCSVFIVDEDGAPHRVAEAATTPEAEAALSRLRALPVPRSLAEPMTEALGDQSLRRFDDYGAWVQARLGGEYPEYVALIAELGPTDAMVVPLWARGRVLGVLTLGMLRRSGRHFSREDEHLAREIGERAGLALDNTRLFAAAGQARRAAEASEERCQAALARAEEASAAKDEFLAMLGHELRNPLAPMLTALHLMRLRYGSLIDRERGVIERQVQHMVRLVDDLLDVSRITRGKVELKRGPVELRRVLDKALEIAAPLLERRGHRLILEVRSEGLQVDGDEHRLAQVAANLLTNAAHYTDPGGRLEVRARAVDDFAELRVIDNGAGIPAELLTQIFDVFKQGRRSIDRADGGLGLGLAIVRSLVELHGGTVTAHSRGPGHGSEFVVRLPLIAAETVPAPAPVRREPRSLSCRVLIVDDNRGAAELLAEALAAGGPVTRVACDGPDALRMAAALRPDVALLDIGLPVMDGFELASRLRQLPGLAAIKLVALTGYGQATDLERSRAAGFDAHLTKPAEIEQVEAVLRELLAAPGRSAASL